MIKLLTDSTSDISFPAAAGMGVDIVPLQVLFGSDAYRDGLDITMDEFYGRLAGCKQLPTTSQPTPGDFLPFFQAAKESGDSLIAILLSGGLSGTCQSALIAKDMVNYDKIHIIDSQNTICGLRLLVDQARAMRDGGKPVHEIVASLEEMKSRVVLLAIVDTLEYLHKGGRLSGAGMVAGSLLNFKPIITLKDGLVQVAGKPRGTNKAITYILEALEKTPPANSAPVYFGYTHNDEKCRLLMEQVQSRHHFPDTAVCPVGSVIGTHAGPNAGVIVYLAAQ